MNDLATLNGQPHTLRVGDREYKVHPLTLNDLGHLQSWVNDQLPDPLDLVKDRLGGLPPDAAKFLLKEALAEARKGKPKLGTPEADALAGSVDGVREMLYLSIRRGDPAFTREHATELCGKLSMADVGRLFASSYGLEPGGNGDPKAAAGVAVPSTGGASTTP